MAFGLKPNSATRFLVGTSLIESEANQAHSRSISAGEIGWNAHCGGNYCNWPPVSRREFFKTAGLSFKDRNQSAGKASYGLSLRPNATLPSRRKPSLPFSLQCAALVCIPQSLQDQPLCQAIRFVI